MGINSEPTDLGVMPGKETQGEDSKKLSPLEMRYGERSTWDEATKDRIRREMYERLEQMDPQERERRIGALGRELTQIVNETTGTDQSFYRVSASNNYSDQSVISSALRDCSLQDIRCLDYDIKARAFKTTTSEKIASISFDAGSGFEDRLSDDGSDMVELMQFEYRINTQRETVDYYRAEAERLEATIQKMEADLARKRDELIGKKQKYSEAKSQFEKDWLDQTGQNDEKGPEATQTVSS